MSEEFKATISVGGQEKVIEQDSNLQAQVDLLTKLLRLNRERSEVAERTLLKALANEQTYSKLWQMQADRPIRYHLRKYCIRFLCYAGILKFPAFYYGDE